MEINVNLVNVVAFLGVLSTFVLGYLGYRRSKKADTVAQKAGAVEQVIGGLNALVDNLQEDNKVLRDNIKELRDALEKVTKERDGLKREVLTLNKQYGQTSK